MCTVWPPATFEPLKTGAAGACAARAAVASNGGKEVGKSLVDVTGDGLPAMDGGWLGCVLGIGC